MNKYILDTSALIGNPSAWESYPNSTVIIPIASINELDKLKKQPGQVGRNARVCIRKIDEISTDGNITCGIKLEDNITLIVDATYHDLSKPQFAGFGDASYGDTQILACAYSHLKKNQGPVTLISNDINLRLKAKSHNMQATGQQDTEGDTNEIYSGVQAILNEDAGLALQKNKVINPEDYNLELSLNEFVTFENIEGNELSLGRKISDNQIRSIKRHTPWGISARNNEQTFALDLLMDPKIDLVTLIGKAGSGKSLIALAAAMELVINRKEYDKLVIYRPIQPVGNDIGYMPGPQPLDAKILTPNGWLTMGDMRIGSTVISKDGTTANVLGVYPKGSKSIYKITTTDGRSTECCEDHLWLTQTWEEKKRQKNGKVRSTKEIINTLNNKNGKINHYLPYNKPVVFNKQNLFISPYIIGVLLGDGSISNSISFTNVDQELIDRVIKEVPNNINVVKINNSINYNFKTNNLFNNKTAQKIKITNINDNQVSIYSSIGKATSVINLNQSTLHNRCVQNMTIDGFKYEFLPSETRWQNPIKEECHKLGLLGLHAWEKFIPEMYKYTSIDDRIALLQGLMDTDGTIKKSGEASFTTTSIKLANDVVELVQSLGGRAKIRSRNRIGKQTNINGHLVTARRISYEFNISLPANINPFHISRKAKLHQCKYMGRIGIKSIEYVGEKEAQCILIDNPEHLYITDNYIVTHNTKEEKLAPWFQAIMDSFEYLFSNKKGDWRRDLEMFQRKGQIEMEALTYIRGRSISNTIILIDESQNISKEDIKTILTRAGEGSKLILTGDIEQIDAQHLDFDNNGLHYVIDKFKDINLAGHVTFKHGERSRLASLAATIL